MPKKIAVNMRRSALQRWRRFLFGFGRVADCSTYALQR